MLGMLDASGAAAQRARADSARADSAAVLPTVATIATIRPAASALAAPAIAAHLARLDAGDLRASARRGVVSVLEQRAGFAVYDDLGSSSKLTISSRGFAASPVVGTPQGVAVFLDGVRMNEPDAAQVNFDLLPTEHIDHIEILSGNGSFLGRNALGGGVNIVTKRGSSPTVGDLSLSAGSFGGRSADANFAGTTPFAMNYYIGASANGDRGWRQVTGAHAANALVNLDWSRGEQRLRIGFLSSRSRAETAGALPESVFDTRPDSNLSSGDYEDLAQAQLTLTGDRRLGGGRASLVTYARRHHAERFNVNQQDDADVLGSSSNTTVGGTFDYQWGRSIGRSAVLSLRVGVDGAGSRATILLHTDSTKFGGGRRVTTDVRSPTWDIASFAMADLQLSRFTWSTGFRYDHVAIPFDDRSAPDADTTGTYDQISPRVAAAFNVGRGLTAFASLGRSFRAPALIENACAHPEHLCPLPFALGDDPPLKAVRATSLEAGASYESGRVQSSVSVYRTDLRDDIFVTASPGDVDEGTVDGYFVNLARTQRIGIESNVRVGLHGGHSMYAAYSYTRATFQSVANIASLLEIGDGNIAEPGDRMPLVPAHQLRAGVDARIARAVGVGLDGRYIGSQWLRGDEANQDRPLDGYVVVDARTSWTVKGWDLTAAVANLLRQQRAVFGTYNVNEGAIGRPSLERFLTPSAPRAVRLSVHRRFGPADGP
jgi:outer membrane receptor protein involved in Fe transport